MTTYSHGRRARSLGNHSACRTLCAFNAYFALSASQQQQQCQRYFWLCCGMCKMLHKLFLKSQAKWVKCELDLSQVALVRASCLATGLIDMWYTYYHYCIYNPERTLDLHFALTKTWTAKSASLPSSTVRDRQLSGKHWQQDGNTADIFAQLALRIWCGRNATWHLPHATCQLPLAGGCHHNLA